MAVGTTTGEARGTLKVEIGSLELTLVGTIDHGPDGKTHINVGFEELPLPAADIAQISLAVFEAQTKLKALGTDPTTIGQQVAQLRTDMERSALSAARAQLAAGLPPVTVSLPKLLVDLKSTFVDFDAAALFASLPDPVPSVAASLAGPLEAAAQQGAAAIDSLNAAIGGPNTPALVKSLLGGQATMSKLVIDTANSNYQFGFRIQYPDTVTEVSWYPGPPKLVGIEVRELTLEVSLAKKTATTATTTTTTTTATTTSTAQTANAGAQ
jgi:hypothetical protein